MSEPGSPPRHQASGPAGRSVTQEIGDRVLDWSRRFGATLWRLIVTTVGTCMRYRVTGLAAEAAFFAVLSVPPLIFALAGAVGYVTDRFTPAQVADVRQAILDLANQGLTDGAVHKVIEPTIDDVLRGGRFDVISVGFILALWSGSRALNVFVDTITIMHGLGGHRGIVATRALSFVLYALAMVTGAGNPLSQGIPDVIPETQLPSVNSSAVYVFALPDR